jgi:hypothetical protein
MKNWIFFLAVMLICARTGWTQTLPRPEIQVEDFVERLFNLQASDANYEDLYEQLLLLYANPLDLNDASPDELRNTYILSEKQVQDFLTYRQRNGRLLSIYELQAVPSMDAQTIQLLLPFIQVNEIPQDQDNRGLWKRICSEPNNSLMVRNTRLLEPQTGYSAAEPDANGKIPTRYIGDPNRIFVRYRVSHARDFSFGFTAEKDPGEQLKWNPSTRQYGMDFWSAHAMLENRGIFNKIILGDYQYQFGQGLVYSAGFAVGKGAEPVTTVRRSSLGIRPYTSALEGMYFRGGGASIEWKNFQLTLLGSEKRIDGNLETLNDTIDNDFIETFATAISITGLHRTPTEISNKGNNRERMATAALQYRHPSGRFECGALATTIHYAFEIRRRPSFYNQFDFNGNQNQNFSFSAQYQFQNFAFFGESAVSRSGGNASIAGLLGSVGKGLDVSMVVRSYSPDYQAFYSNAFGELSRNANEQGIYWGIKYRFHSRWLAAFYYDMFRYPYASYLSDGPSVGSEYLSRITYTPTKTMSLFLQYRDESKLRNLSGNEGKTDVLVNTRRQNWVLQADAKVDTWLSFRSRLQGSRWMQEKGAASTYGLAVSQDVNLDFGKISISNRFSLFDTDDFNNRQYLYEKNVLYAFSIPALNGRGIRWYSLIQFAPTRKLDVWIRFAQTIQRDMPSIGSGLEEINGPSRSEITAQIRLKF